MKKTFVLLLSTWMLGQAALAFDEGDVESVSPMRPAAKIAEMRMFGGLRPPTMPSESGVRVYSDGTAFLFNDDQVQAILTLDPAQTKELLARIEKLEEAPLFDADEEMPRCLDIPEVEFVAIQASGKKITVARRSMCHSFAMQNGHGYDIRDVLEGVSKLSLVRTRR